MKNKQQDRAIRWVFRPGEHDRLMRLDENGFDGEEVPEENEVITRPFLVEPGSQRPVPVRVVQRLEWHHRKATTFVVVVSRQD